jgi:hypothetical protein
MAGGLNPPRPAKFFKEGAKDTKVRMLFLLFILAQVLVISAKGITQQFGFRSA